MHNFEVRYRAIVERRGELWHDDVRTSMTPGCWVDDNNQQVEQSLARAAVCWWLAGKLPDEYRICTNNNGADLEKWDDASESWWAIKQFTDPADAILTAWEIILGIKEKA